MSHLRADLGLPLAKAYCLGNTTLAWNIQSFISIREFSLEVQHSFSDPA